MTDRDCVEFLQWVLPRLRLHWPGFRKVRRQVCRRLRRRMADLGLPHHAAYRAYLEHHPGEWTVLDGLTRITISRYYRDRALFEALVRDVLPEIARGCGRQLRVWSAGCASGEEPYTIALAWRLELEPRLPDVRLRVLATDVDETMLRRAAAACYGAASLRDLPPAWRETGFAERDGQLCLHAEYRQVVTLSRHDVRTPPPSGPFDLVLCRNLAFTYFAPDLQREVAGALAGVVRPGGALALGAHEQLPEGERRFAPTAGGAPVWRRVTSS